MFTPYLNAGPDVRFYSQFFIVGYAASAIGLRIAFRKSAFSLAYSRQFFGFIYWYIAIIISIFAPIVLTFTPFLNIAGVVPKIGIVIVLILFLSLVGLWFRLSDLLKAAEADMLAKFWREYSTLDYEKILSEEEFEHHPEPQITWKDRLRKRLDGLRWKYFKAKIRVRRYLRRRGVGSLIIILTISSTMFGVARWESSQTLNGLTIYCVQSSNAVPEASSPKLSHFDVTVGFHNPNWFPIDVEWDATPVLNDSAYFGGVLRDVIPPLSYHLSKMEFSFIQAFVQPTSTYILNKVVSYERYSTLGDTFSDPRIFFITSEKNTLFRPPNSVLNLTANNMNTVLYFTFIQHSNFRNDQDGLCAPYGT